MRYVNRAASGRWAQITLVAPRGDSAMVTGETALRGRS
jgi:hypothetical protein